MRMAIRKQEFYEGAALHLLTWNRHDRMGQRVSSGIILYRAVAGPVAFTGKVVLTQ